MGCKTILNDGEESDGFFRAILDASPMPVLVVAEGRCVYGNERFTALRGCKGCGAQCGFEAMLEDSNRQAVQLALQTLKPGETAKLSLDLYHLDGHATAVDIAFACMAIKGQTFVMGIISERTEKERIRRLLDRLAFYDSLTELPNRVLLFDRINQSLSRFHREGGGFAVAILDLDGFKEINDRLGHVVGDCVLKGVASRLARCVRNVDTIARQGGDEFALILQGVSNESEASAVLNKIIQEVAAPLDICGSDCRVTASVGIAFCPQDGISIGELLGRADYAMYQAKRRGGDCYHLSTGETSATFGRLELEPLIDVIKLGFEVLDEQHEEIAVCVRGLLRGVTNGESSEMLQRRVEYLQQLTEDHFALEEDYILRYALRGQDDHRGEHANLLRQLNDLAPNHDNHGLTVMSHLFREWLVPHIETKDNELVNQLKAVGVTG